MEHTNSPDCPCCKAKKDEFVKMVKQRLDDDPDSFFIVSVGKFDGLFTEVLAAASGNPDLMIDTLAGIIEKDPKFRMIVHGAAAKSIDPGYFDKMKAEFMNRGRREAKKDPGSIFNFRQENKA